MNKGTEQSARLRGVTSTPVGGIIRREIGSEAGLRMAVGEDDGKEEGL